VVDAFIKASPHPLKPEIEVARRIILGVSPEIGEGIKWNAPIFRTTEFFATANLRARDQIQFIFHLGAKKRAGLKGLKITDPDGLIKWLAPDRCLVTLGAGKNLSANRAAFATLVRQWIKYV